MSEHIHEPELQSSPIAAVLVGMLVGVLIAALVFALGHGFFWALTAYCAGGVTAMLLFATLQMRIQRNILKLRHSIRGGWGEISVQVVDGERVIFARASNGHFSSFYRHLIFFYIKLHDAGVVHVNETVVVIMIDPRPDDIDEFVDYQLMLRRKLPTPLIVASTLFSRIDDTCERAALCDLSVRRAVFVDDLAAHANKARENYKAVKDRNSIMNCVRLGPEFVLH